MKAEALIDALAGTLAEIDIETVGDAQVKVKAGALADALADTKKKEAETPDETLSDVKGNKTCRSAGSQTTKSGGRNA